VPPDVITMPYGSFGRARWDQLVSRLRGSSSARLVFAMQAALASLGLLPSEPDGVWGQNTDAAVVSLTAALGLPIDAARPPVALVYGRIVAYLARRPGTRLLVQGFALPRGLIEQVNRESWEALSGFPPLQIYVAEDFGWRP
jgi:peptidoglycan hydrolase-like protein with peptidoglycan-binding domain